MSNNIDAMLRKCGDFNRYQFIQMGLFAIVNLLASMHYYSQTMISFVPEHWCYSPELKNLPIDQIRSIYSKYDNPHCTPYTPTSSSPEYNEYFVTNLTTKLVENNYDLAIKLFHVSDNKPIAGEPICDKFIYDLDYGYESMSVDHNWVCTSAWKSTLGQSLFFVGSAIGSLFFGILADKIGRLPVLILAFMTALIGNSATIFTKTLSTFSIARFISGMASDSNFLMMYILVMEYIRPSMRTFGLNLVIGIFYCTGSMITPWIAVLAGSWKWFLFITVLPIFIIPLFYLIVPESAQWLISQKQCEKAIKCFKIVAKFNGKYLGKESINEFRQNISNETKESKNNRSPNILSLFQTPRLRKHTLILFFKSMVITLCYDAISKNVEGLGLSPFLMFSLSAVAIFPACLVILFLQDKIGRKAMASSSLFVSGIFTAATGIAIVYQKQTQNSMLLASLSIIGRFGVTVAYNSGAQYATELIPTCVRAQGVAAVHVVGYAFTFFSSYILYLSNICKPLPSLILGGLSLAGAIVCLFLPETLNRTLPCTLEDGEHFGIGEKVLDFSFCEKPNIELGIHILK